MHAENMTQVPRPAGRFRAVETRDAEAHSRSGDSFFQYRLLEEREPSDRGALYEILFGDGMWMLARRVDLEFFER